MPRIKYFHIYLMKVKLSNNIWLKGWWKFLLIARKQVLTISIMKNSNIDIYSVG